MADLAIDGGQPVRTRPFPGPDPDIRPDDGQALAEVVRSGHLWRIGGTEVDALEAAFAQLLDVPAGRVIASSSGTAAIHLAVGAINPEPGDEIIVPPITDFGTVIPVLAQNAIPVFADVRPDTYCLDPQDVARKLSPRTRAIIAVHLFGQPCDIALRQLARDRGIALIEDAAQAPLAVDHGQLAGTIGDFGCFSLQQSKHITAGEGGLTVVSDPERAERARLFADKGWPRAGDIRTHLFLGMNYRLTELQGAVARRQLPRLAAIVARRRATAAELDAALQQVPALEVPRLPSGVHSAYWMYHFNVPDHAEEVAAAVRAEGIPLHAGYVMPLYLTPALREQRTYGQSRFPFDSPYARPQPPFGPGLCPVAETAAHRLCYLNLHQHIGPGDASDIAAAVAKVMTAFGRRYQWNG